MPHVKGLRTLDLLKFLVDECDGADYLPKNFKAKTIHRDWLTSLCMFFNNIIIGNSLHCDRFSDFIDRKLEQRQNKLIKKNCLSIQVPQQIADIFTNSRMVSSKSFLANVSNIACKGKSNLLLNREKRFKKETLKRLEEEKRNQDHQMIKDLQQEVLLLQDEIKLREFDKNEADKNQEILRVLYEDKIIDENGKPFGNDD